MVETYTALREFADSWALLALTVIFIGIVAYTFRPSSKRFASGQRGNTVPQ